MYRLTRRTPLATGQKYGAIIRNGELPAHIIEAFLKSGTLVKMELPPLAVLPDEWQERRELLATVNIHTIGDLLDAKEREVSKAIKRPPKIIKEWKTEAERWLSNPNSTTND